MIHLNFEVSPIGMQDIYSLYIQIVSRVWDIPAILCSQHAYGLWRSEYREKSDQQNKSS
jgi:hypothetical protein